MLQKPEPRARVKARQQRHAAKVVKSVRAACVEREFGVCSAYWGVNIDQCQGQLEWAHLEDWKRFKTRGKPATERHTTKGSCMLCTRHHRAYDRGDLRVTFFSERGADGPMQWSPA